jgi:hypothetical protein
MHARADNPELIRAKELGLKIYSYPEYIYEATKNKTRIVIGGSHGKTTITAMILHVMHYHKIETDFLVGAQLEGFDTMVNLTNTSKFAVIEGDEYLASPIDRRPKFHLYKPTIAIISGIAWDHINVFPTFENYVEQFTTFINLIEPNGHLIYCDEDKVLAETCKNAANNKITKTPYSIPANEIINGNTNLLVGNKKIPLQIFGNHNLMNLNDIKQQILDNEILTEQSKRELLNYCDDSTQHCTYLITYSDLLIYVWSRIINNENKNEILKVLYQEISDGLCMCFTGRLTRLLNTLVGFYNDIEIQISDSEQITNIIISLKNKYEKDELKIELRKALIERQYSESIINEWLEYI